MKRVFLAGVAGLSCLVLVQAAYALRIMMVTPPAPQRIAQADVVVLGKVTAVEDKTVMAERFPGDKEKGEYRIVVVKINDALVGAKDLTHLKVGYVVPKVVPPGPGGTGGPGGGIRPHIRPGFRPQPVSLNKGQEGCLFLKPHHKESFYVVNTTMDVLDKSAPNYDNQVKELKQYAKIAADPMTALKSKDADERFKGAATLIYRYRTNRGMGKTEEVPAAESKLILEALAGGNWNTPARADGQVNAQTLFAMLGAQPKDGWTQPADFRQFPEAAKAWLKTHADSFRLQRFVDGAPEK